MNLLPFSIGGLQTRRGKTTIYKEAFVVMTRIPFETYSSFWTIIPPRALHILLYIKVLSPEGNWIDLLTTGHEITLEGIKARTADEIQRKVPEEIITRKVTAHFRGASKLGHGPIWEVSFSEK